MEDLREILLENEDYLLERVLSYMDEQGYAAHASMPEVACRLSVSGITEALIEEWTGVGEIRGVRAEDPFIHDPLSSFGVLEAQRHRERETPLGVFLGLFKYYRQAFLDLVARQRLPRHLDGLVRGAVERGFDRIEIALAGEWVRASEEDLRETARANEFLLREVNHRVKNNLSAIISMLHKEEERVGGNGGGRYLPMLQDLIVRVRGLSTVHSLLSAGGWRPLELGDLCRSVFEGSLEVLSAAPAVAVDVDAASVRVDGDQAHHITLVLNELATNIVKHALGDRGGARVRLRIVQAGGRARIEVRDDGPGYPEEMVQGDLSKAKLGFQLIRGITERSLVGSVEIENDGGAVTRLDFPTAGNGSALSSGEELPHA